MRAKQPSFPAVSRPLGAQPPVTVLASLRLAPAALLIRKTAMTLMKML